MQINVNGQNYSRWEDVPAEVRQKLAATLPDADKNGVPDLFETGALPTGTQTFASTSIIVNGQPVQSAADLSPEMQAKLQQALGMIAPMFGTAGMPTAAVPGQTPTPAPGAPPPPLADGQVMLNGVPTVVGGSTPAKKGFFRRLFGA
ncbi:MAG: hypothetical protein QOD98_2201 [Nocardioidaceae bacterium]|jgi:hypothetical protein|nr:hypothetical protein [Nocardioidaceae bacterium]